MPAYDDAAGVTAAFNLNLLTRLNRDAAADFDPALFRHRAIWNDAESRIEMHLESLTAQVGPLAGQPISFMACETIPTENRYKHRPEDLIALANQAGWQLDRMWTDPDRRFAVYLLE